MRASREEPLTPALSPKGRGSRTFSFSHLGRRWRRSGRMRESVSEHSQVIWECYTTVAVEWMCHIERILIIATTHTLTVIQVLVFDWHCDHQMVDFNHYHALDNIAVESVSHKRTTRFYL